VQYVCYYIRSGRSKRSQLLPGNFVHVISLEVNPPLNHDQMEKKKEHLQGTIKCKLCQFHLPECPTLEKTYFHGIQINNYRGGHDYFEWFFF